MRVSELPSIRSPQVYATVIGVTLLTTGVGIFVDFSLGSFAFDTLLVAVAATGIPHGAVDHLVAAELYELDETMVDQAKFYGGYLGLMLLYSGLWFIAPVWSLVLFLVMTMYHFGQADLAYWNLSPLAARLLYMSRGLFLIGVPIVAFPDVVAPIFEAIAREDLLGKTFVHTNSAALFWGIVLQHLVALGLAATACRTSGLWRLGREAGNLAVLTCLFGSVHPLVAFSVYFGVWHSPGHILELLRFFRRRQSTPATLKGFYRRAAPFTILSLAGLGGLYAVTNSFGMTNQMIALLFVLIAVMTLPHMVIVENLYQAREGETIPTA